MFSYLLPFSYKMDANLKNRCPLENHIDRFWSAQELSFYWIIESEAEKRGCPLVFDDIENINQN